MKNYYAIHYPCGKNTCYANSGRPVAHVYGFSSRKERDQAISEYSAPNHCPQAELTPALASNPIVRAAVREHGDNFGVFNWSVTHA